MSNYEIFQPIINGRLPQNIYNCSIDIFCGKCLFKTQTSNNRLFDIRLISNIYKLCKKVAFASNIYNCSIDIF